MTENQKERSSLPNRPLVWVTLSIAAGIMLSQISSSVPNLLWLLLITTLSSGAVAVLTRRPVWFTVTLLLMSALLGFLRCKAQDAIAVNDVSLLAPSDVRVTGIIDSEIRETYSENGMRPAREKFTLRTESASTRFSSSLTVSGRVDVSLALDAGRNMSSSQLYSELAPCYGDRIEVIGHLDLPNSAGNPGGHDELVALARRGVHSRLTVAIPANWQILQHASHYAMLLVPVYRLKNAILAHGHRVLNRERSGVLNAILLGAKSELSPANRALFEKTGTMHVLSTAGLHTGLVVGILLYLLPMTGMPRRYSTLTTLTLLVVFTIMASDRPAVVRAAVMAAVYLVGVLIEREPNWCNAISLAAMGLLLANPFNLFDFGFQISFATVITLALAMPLTRGVQQALARRMLHLRSGAYAPLWILRYLAACLSVTIVAQVGSMPLILYYFNLFTPAGLVANLLVVPVIGVIIAIGFPAALIGAITPGLNLTLPLDWILDRLTGYVLAVVKLCAEPAFGVSSQSSPPAWSIILYYVLLWSGLGLWRMKEQTKS